MLEGRASEKTVHYSAADRQTRFRNVFTLARVPHRSTPPDRARGQVPTTPVSRLAAGCTGHVLVLVQLLLALNTLADVLVLPTGVGGKVPHTRFGTHANQAQAW